MKSLSSLRRRPFNRTLLLASMLAFSVCTYYCFNAIALESAETKVPRSVEEIKTREEASEFLQHALESTEWVTSQRDFQNSSAAQLAHQQAVDTLTLAIQWLEMKAVVEPARPSTRELQKDEQSLLGVWRHRLNVDGTENLMIFGPNKSFVAVRGPQVWVGNW